MADGSFFQPSNGPLNQGDILIAPVARVTAADRFVPERWGRLDQDEVLIDRSDVDAEDIELFAGRELVMVTSHDCHHDKEWNAARGRLIRQGNSEEDADRLAEEDDTLDRTFQASPIVPLDDFDPGTRGNYRAGRVVGYFPIPESPDGAFPESVVDLSYRCTIDRKAITNRRWCLGPEPRDQLRYAIARFDSFRSVELGETIEQAVGREIVDVEVDTSTGLIVVLTLDDGEVLRLVQPPADPEPGGRESI
ncbi:MAG: hypothetical protein JJLCMIEE_02975 [Acidimicrobiales bacterium]|nr:MAG: hypothetical protein EDR02_03590 [Actinomycetota bacterium]MBV6509862.1 hypothetical protein [Acidimicrobiales bacterium]RIK06201.1 MAG: hypothetical protein DCC48_07150 [Acidobacteriota bacterium]